ncbi:hypothetical protein LWI29_028038 [Acer saccharum]|uniref:Uncharacterized protein n=1 Tax=Acer saccharum TaxID=4024 RepID=A0AA39TEX6_ACESA|nr:hypothetical protein LWI29_028038 [Acer saccharum]
MRSDSRKDHDDGDDHIVMGDEIARAVRCVMDGDSEIRKKVKVMSGKSMLEGGSSFDSIGQFIEQKFNAFMMVKELGLAAVIESGSGKDNGGLVAVEEIARAVRHLMDVDNEIGKKAMEMAEISKKSLMEGGSSFVSLGKFIDLNF